MDFIKLMSQTLPCRAQCFNIDRSCRMGCQVQENICHILQKCPGAHYPHILQPNDALQLLVKSLKVLKYNVMVEPRFQTPEGL